jgi:hypothetical protein
VLGAADRARLAADDDRAAARFLIGGLMTAVLAIELLLAFSRGAWGAFGAAAALMLGLTYLTSGSGRERRRIILIATLGTVVLGALIVVILLSPAA